jgi:DNA-binding IclR family transcriptional regulator
MDKTVVKALKVMEALGRSPKPRGIADLAAELGLGKSNVHRLLDTLVTTGYVRRHTDVGRYELSLKLWEIGTSVLERLDLRRDAGDTMQWLLEQTGETVHLCILDGGDGVYIERLQGSRPLSNYLNVGSRAPAHRTASGRVLLAHLDPGARAALLAPLRRELTPDGHADLLRDLEKVHKAGFATNPGGYRPEVSSVAAPVFRAGGQCIAAIAVSGPRMRLPPRKLREFASNEVAEAARRISQVLGA